MTMDYIEFLKKKQIQTQAIGFEANRIINIPKDKAKNQRLGG